MKEAYLDLLKKMLTDYHRLDYDQYKPLYNNNASWKLRQLKKLDRWLNKRGYKIFKLNPTSSTIRENGMDWPAHAETMIGLKRLNNLEYCYNLVKSQNIKGDLLEAGVWRGGASIFMAALLKTNGDKNRKVWLADSFKGLPKPNPNQYPMDQNDPLHKMEELAVSSTKVKENFMKYDLWSDQVRFIEGFYKDTLPVCEVDQLSILRLDCDTYESTLTALTYLYPKLITGGFVIVDDYNAFESCKAAVMDYCKQYNIQPKIIEIDQEAVYWQK